MKKKKPILPTKKKIKEYWSRKVVEMKPNTFDSVEQLNSGDYCFACGVVTNGYTERAHILARSIGGSDTEDNLHLLCDICHKASEMLDGDEYVDWFVKRNHIDMVSDMYYKVNYQLFRSFREDIDNVRNEGVDPYSKNFLDNLNRLRLLEFKAEAMLEKIANSKSKLYRNSYVQTENLVVEPA